MQTGFDETASLDLARRLARAAWSAIQPHFRAGVATENKGGRGASYDPVTLADKAAEQAIRDILAAERPDDGIDGEEFGRHEGPSGWTWLIDPIDGTRAFIAGLPVWTTLIALVDPEGDPVLGMIDQPFLGERYVGSPAGTFLETATARTQLRVSQCNDLRDAIIATTDPFIMTPAEQGAWTHLRHTARVSRYGLDAYAYARLASGSVDLVCETGLQAHDVAALIPVVRGAGGIARDWRGNEAKLGSQIACAASEPLFEQALISLRRSAL
ncbi:histidinol-phosphatase [Henriciella mobilis]|uniref:inositol monophosphatase family protein n=1 Tax=Henriciella mobilis TaxID=2305467 RepID=UPI000E67226A|nr:inositol monophosphatase family protein [Henriciella mobilis]RIJ17504.1 histidinol-phosphatase [Henriciella mobilis]RIJ25508.1 histidinol-phosphatase [Henriciella mobilis]